jgi:hypothetical protein
MFLSVVDAQINRVEKLSDFNKHPPAPSPPHSRGGRESRLFRLETQQIHKHV